MKLFHKGVEFFCDQDIPDEEAVAYISRGIDIYGSRLKTIHADVVDDEWVDLRYSTISIVPFDRIRRITGYLVGTLDRFNDGKRAEEADRVKHSIQK